MKQHQQTLEALMSAGLITDGDIAVFCSEAPPASASLWGGAIGAALASSKCGHFILAVNDKGLKLFDIDKKTGIYLNTFTPISKDEISKLRVSKFGKQIGFKCASGTLRYNSPNKFCGYPQKEKVAQTFDYLKQFYY